MLNKAEFEAVRGLVKPEHAEMCLNDACAEVIFDAYDLLYGPFDPASDDPEVWERMNRIDTYAIELLRRIRPEIVQDGELAARFLPCFDETEGGYRYLYSQSGDLYPVVTVRPKNGVWEALEADSTGDVTHRGTGRTAQDALYAMRLVM